MEVSEVRLHSFWESTAGYNQFTDWGFYSISFLCAVNSGGRGGGGEVIIAFSKQHLTPIL